MRTTIPAAEAAELMQLYRSLPRLIWEATNRIRIYPPANVLADADLERFRDSDEKVATVMSRIRNILDQ